MSTKSTQELSDLVKAAGITRLYWIDDYFGTTPLLSAKQIALKIDVLWSLAEGEKLAHPLLKEIPVGSIPDKIAERVLTAIKSSDSTDIARQLSESVDYQIAAHNESHRAGVNDLTPNQFDQIKRAFEEGSATVSTLSFAQWTEQWEEIKGAIDQNVVFFVDRDFTREEGGKKKYWPLCSPLKRPHLAAYFLPTASNDSNKLRNERTSPGEFIRSRNGIVSVSLAKITLPGRLLTSAH